ncbi:hypothetical protein [Clostridium saccharoperbutylacetonicum]|uniref:hypothetical protein n=1 Tax=Clostridium saccharoperbutylacetonicum TaxID=36745 RepID=UPI000983DC77|nr:hypothetical protein [Clostridium saccharoperbutylacetonicum]AQR94900.1 hypothetical protein CLSAP_22140 [Clostridium saccharoperbutylacetonicum]NSB30742.1 PBP1b-binding outer membrane lipoprotein LpoB [Clostridium saccharoperbutylacetonicum]
MKKIVIISFLTISLFLNGCSSFSQKSSSNLKENTESVSEENNKKELKLKGMVVERTEDKFVFAAISESGMNTYMFKSPEDDKRRLSKLRKGDEIIVEGTVDETSTEGKITFYLKKLEIDTKKSYKNEEESEKYRQESLVAYADLIKEIEDEYQNIKVSYIVGKNQKKIMSIEMQQLLNQELTLEEIEKLTVEKEIRLKDDNIHIILISVKEKDKDVRIISFSLENGKYVKIVDQFT